jgi:hypothetical protein
LLNPCSPAGPWGLFTLAFAVCLENTGFTTFNDLFSEASFYFFSLMPNSGSIYKNPARPGIGIENQG